MSAWPLFVLLVVVVLFMAAMALANHGRRVRWCDAAEMASCPYWTDEAHHCVRPARHDNAHLCGCGAVFR